MRRRATRENPRLSRSLARTSPDATVVAPFARRPEAARTGSLRFVGFLIDKPTYCYTEGPGCPALAGVERSAGPDLCWALSRLRDRHWARSKLVRGTRLSPWPVAALVLPVPPAYAPPEWVGHLRVLPGFPLPSVGSSSITNVGSSVDGSTYRGRTSARSSGIEYSWSVRKRASSERERPAGPLLVPDAGDAPRDLFNVLDMMSTVRLIPHSVEKK